MLLGISCYWGANFTIQITIHTKNKKEFIKGRIPYRHGDVIAYEKILLANPVVVVRNIASRQKVDAKV